MVLILFCYFLIIYVYLNSLKFYLVLLNINYIFIILYNSLFDHSSKTINKSNEDYLFWALSGLEWAPLFGTRMGFGAHMRMLKVLSQLIVAQKTTTSGPPLGCIYTYRAD